jgi:hypothetical protein
MIRFPVMPDGGPCRGFARKAVAHGFQGYATGGRIPGPQAVCGVRKDHVRHPVARVFDGPTGMDHRAGRIGRAHRHGDAEAHCAPDLSVILRPISVMAGRFTPAPASAAIRAAKHQRTAPGVARIPPRGSCAGLPRGKGRKRHRSAIFVMLKPATAQNVAAPSRTARPVRPDHPSGGPSRMPPERPVGEAAALPCAASGSRQGCGPGRGGTLFLRYRPAPWPRGLRPPVMSLW